VSTKIPGAAAADRYHRLLIAVTQALLGNASADSTALIEEESADSRLLLRQLLASIGLAALLEARGEAARASVLRAFVQQRAPHCAPLHDPVFVLSSPAVASLGGTLAVAGPPGHEMQRAKRSVGRLLATTADWFVLIVLFVTVYQAFQGR